MRYISLEQARAGMVLANELYDSYGRVLIGANHRLTESYIKKLQNYGFGGLYISDELSEGIEVQSVISPQLKARGMECVRVCNIDGCKRIAKQIVEEILSKEGVSFDLADLRSYDDYTYAHSVNVGVICGVIGMGMYMSERELIYMVTAALLHDMGKQSVPPEILNKPGRLTPEEYAVMKTHAQRSYELIRERWDISARVKTAVLFHHENVDGSGYPRGISGDEQTLYTKILHVADVYDALVSKRPYKNPYSPYEASEYLMGACGSLFDKEAVDTLLRYVPLYPRGTMVQLSNGQSGIIYDNSGLHNLRPILRMMDGSMLDLADAGYLNVSLMPADNFWEQIEEAEKGRLAMLESV